MLPATKTFVNRLKEAINDYINYTEDLNECAYSDRMLEIAIDRARDLVFTEETRYDTGLSSIYAKNIEQAATIENVKVSKATIKLIIKDYGSKLMSFTIDDYRILVREKGKPTKA